MKKRIISACCLLILMLGIMAATTTDIEASSEKPIVDGSYLTHDTESIGYPIQLTRGEDLLNGYSKIVKVKPGTVYAGGTTLAIHTVDLVKIAVMVERVKQEGDSWEFVESWQAEKTFSDRVAANRRLNVEGNYYYRVRCTHSAGEDLSSSFTNGVFVEEP